MCNIKRQKVTNDAARSEHGVFCTSPWLDQFGGGGWGGGDTVPPSHTPLQLLTPLVPHLDRPLLRQPYLFVATSPPPLSALTGDRPRPLAFLDRLTAAPFVPHPVDTPVSSTPLVSRSLLKLRSPYGSPASPFRPLPPSPGPTFPWRVPLSPPVSPCRFRPHLLGSLLVFGGDLLPALLPSYYVLFTLQRLSFYVSVPRSLILA